MIALLIADDHGLIREGLKKVLREASDIEIAGEAQDAPELFELLQQKRVDGILLDISLPGKSGMDALQEIKQKHPGLPVLILSAHPEELFAVRALKAGASGYVSKDQAPTELVQAIRKVVNGGKYVSSSLAEKLAAEVRNPSDVPLHETLSNREYQILCLIASGKPPREIANELKISINTVNTYRTRMLEKMSMKSDAEVIRYAIEKHLIG
jgi:two-component system invasion response regulator UvrY